MTMNIAEIILTVFLAVLCIIGGILLYRLEHVTALNIDLKRENEMLRKQIAEIDSYIREQIDRVLKARDDEQQKTTDIR